MKIFLELKKTKKIAEKVKNQIYLYLFNKIIIATETGNIFLAFFCFFSLNFLLDPCGSESTALPLGSGSFKIIRIHNFTLIPCLTMFTRPKKVGS